MLIVTFFLGCAPRYYIKVSSLRGTNEIKKSFFLFPGDAKIDPNDLQFLECSRYTAIALERNEFFRSKNSDDSEIMILFSYGVSNPEQHIETSTIPVVNYQPGTSGSFSGNTSTPYGSNYQTYGTYQSSGSYNTTYLSETHTTITFSRYVKLVAIDAKLFREKKIKPLWQTDITSTGSSGDLRLVFPILIAPGAKYFGTNTDHAVSVTVHEKDNEVLAIKNSGLK